VHETFPSIDQRWSRTATTKDTYVTKPVDLAEVAPFRAALGTLYADRGGDYSEAPEKGLADMNRLSCRDGAVARRVLDRGRAPPRRQGVRDAVAVQGHPRARHRPTIRSRPAAATS
jgi:hypothetical protein